MISLADKMSVLYSYQEQIQHLVLQGKSIILQAPTGAGKTRAAQAPFISTYWDDLSFNFPKKCIYTVPMRVLANQFKAEYSELVARYSRLHKQKYEQRALNVSIQTGEYKEDPKFQADLIFATIDQVLSSWLITPYSLPRRLGNLNAGALVGSYLIFDEFHLFDPDSTLPTTLHMLKTLNGGSPFILMTATFSQEMLKKLAHHLNAEAFLLTEDMLTEIPAQHKERRFYTTPTPMTDKDEHKKIWANQTAVSHILQTHQDQIISRPRSLVVCNQVERAQAVYTALRDQAPTGITVRLLHSRFLKKDRQEIEQFIRNEFQKNKDNQTVPSLILVATQVVEVGLDMSCNALHTELAPAAAILQRAGRCARYQGETGQVFVYPVNDNEHAPYHGQLAKQQSQLAWDWLQANQDRHLTFADEQALINHAHTASDNLTLDAVFGSQFEWQSQIESAWRGEKDRGETAVLIRNIQSVSVAVHADPDQLAANPFKTDSFSLHPGTLQGKFAQWHDEHDGLDPEWLICKLIEDTDEEAAQDNRPIQYSFKKVASQHDLYAPLLVINPALVGYSPELGLTLYPSTPYECKLPKTARSTTHNPYSYKLESHLRHIQLVHQAFVSHALPAFTAVASRLEQAYGWRSGIITDMAHLVIALHDIGKLSQDWQTWAQKWQKAIGKDTLTFPAAHTDYNPTNPQHKKANVGKRPTHAVESALATTPILHKLVAEDMEKYSPLFRAAFTAIARHHAPFSSQPASYQLIPSHAQEIKTALQLLPKSIQTVCDNTIVQATANAKKMPPTFLQRSRLIQPRNEKDICCYMLLVRALRTADQEGTRLGSL